MALLSGQRGAGHSPLMGADENNSTIHLWMGDDYFRQSEAGKKRGK